MYIHVPIDHALGESSGTYQGSFSPTLLGALSEAPGKEMICRLLCASNVTYEMIPGSPPTLTKGSMVHTGSRFLDDPALSIQPVKFPLVGKSDIDACLVGTLQGPAASPGVNKSVVLAFRGTLSPTTDSPSTIMTIMQDWLNDLEAPLVTFKGILGAVMPALWVHKGLADSLENLFDPNAKMNTGKTVIAEIKERIKREGAGMLYITGHSKGAALAYLAALALRRLAPDIPSAVISFEAPRPGDKSFADAFSKANIYSERYEFQNDIVPHLPPTGLLAKFLTGAITLSDMASSALVKTVETMLPATTLLPKPPDLRLLSLLYPRAVHTLNYVSPGKLHYIDQSNNIIIDDPTKPESIKLEWIRIWRIIAMFRKASEDALNAGLKELKPVSPDLIRPLIAADLAILNKYFGGLFTTLAGMHAISCGSGHMRALCDTKFCK
jgi:Lipase (class 3)